MSKHRRSATSLHAATAETVPVPRRKQRHHLSASAKNGPSLISRPGRSLAERMAVLGAADISDLPSDFGLTPREAAALLGVAEATLEAWRLHGSGPRFLHVGRRVKYHLGEIRKALARGVPAPELAGTVTKGFVPAKGGGDDH